MKVVEGEIILEALEKVLFVAKKVKDRNDNPSSVALAKEIYDAVKPIVVKLKQRLE